MMVLDMLTGNQGVLASSPLIGNTTNLLNSPNLKEISKKSALDAFSESIGDGSGGERILAADETGKISVMNDVRHYREGVSKFNLKNKVDESSTIKFWTTNGRRFPMLSKVMSQPRPFPARVPSPYQLS